MTTNSLSVTVPQPQIPFLNASGGPSREWLYYMLSILNRTGGIQGISSASLQQQIVSHGVLDAMEDDAPPPTSIAATVLMALTLADDAPRQAMNPILASLLVSDAA